MSRQSSDELAPDGTILNGFDYSVQVWVIDGIVQPCGHPERWIASRANQYRRGSHCCPAHKYAGKPIREVPGHEVRTTHHHAIQDGRGGKMFDGRQADCPLCQKGL